MESVHQDKPLVRLQTMNVLFLAAASYLSDTDDDKLLLDNSTPLDKGRPQKCLICVASAGRKGHSTTFCIQKCKFLDYNLQHEDSKSNILYIQQTNKAHVTCRCIQVATERGVQGV